MSKAFLRRGLLSLAMSAALVGLSACATHVDLTAPCSASWQWMGGSAFASDCGPMRPVNE